MTNRDLYSSNVSGARGVSLTANGEKWYAGIHDKPNHYLKLGIFTKFEDAVAARKEAELKYYGELCK